MVFFLFPDKDTTIYNDSELLFRNSGNDEILEVNKTVRNDPSMSISLSRTLIQFDLSSVKTLKDDGKLIDPRFILNLKSIQDLEIRREFELHVNPVSQSWSEGIGRLGDEFTSDGASWLRRDGVNGNSWFPTSSAGEEVGGGSFYQSLVTVVSGSETLSCFATESLMTEGTNTGSIAGTFEITSSLVSSQSFIDEPSDAKIDVTNLVNAILDNCYDNNGFIVRAGDEISELDFGKIRYFSKDTNTVYSPYLEIQSDDFTFDSGSLDPLDDENKKVFVSNLKKGYDFRSIEKIRVFVREAFPARTFKSTSSFLVPKFVTGELFYGVKDAETEETLVDFSKYTKISLSPKGHFFTFNFAGLAQERFFKFIFKYEEDGFVTIFDNKDIFKINR